MGELGEVVQNHRRVGADVVLRAQFGERGSGITLHHRLEQIDYAHAVGEAQHLPHVLGTHGTGGMGDGLVEQRQGITNGALRRARYQRQRRRFDLYSFFAGDALKMLHQHRRIDATQVKALAARQHRHRYLADLSGGEDELGVRRRLFQGLEQRVERRAREHVDFVEDIDLVARRHRGVADGVVDLAHVVHAVVGGGVHFEYVDVAALDDGLAMHAHRRHRDGRPGDRAVGQFVVERAGEDAGGGCLADAAHAGEDPSLRDAAGLERIRDRAHHGVLADEVVEAGGAVFAGEHAVAAIRRVGRGGTRAGRVRGLAHRAIRSQAPAGARLSPLARPSGRACRQAKRGNWVGG